MLYAWCRHCDDVVDGQELGFPRADAGSPSRTASAAGRRAALAELDEKTREALSGRATDPVFVALQRIVARHRIPPEHPLELIEGFRMDTEGFRPEALGDTLRYCYHVAGVVGVMMAMIMGARSSDALNRAADLGIAFQLTNIVRDIVADAEAGRVYLPAQWLQKSGLAPGDIADPARREVVFGVAARMLAEADAYYASAAGGLRYLPFRSAWAVASARNIYRGIGRVVLAREAEAWTGRARVGAAGKLIGVINALGQTSVAALLPTAPPPRDGLWTRPGLGGPAHRTAERIGHHASGR
jgi:phytoene synthase